MIRKVDHIVGIWNRQPMGRVGVTKNDSTQPSDRRTNLNVGNRKTIVNFLLITS
ncbi:hypothetical protein H0H93_015569 [Arthromyces matolae]|nr:hypothetical protein H0H93_015569 [Arthromyces matolae]